MAYRLHPLSDASVKMIESFIYKISWKFLTFYVSSRLSSLQLDAIENSKGFGKWPVVIYK